MISTFVLIQFLLLIIIVGAAVIPLGRYMARVLSGEPVMLDKIFGWLERIIYRLCGISPRQEMRWREYANAVLALTLISFVVLFAMLLLQDMLPWNPRHLPGVSLHLAFNIAASFITNTNWQSYAGETVLSPFTQMVGLAVQHFISSAMAMAVAATLFRGLKRSHSDTIGNFWVDLTRSTLYILLPLSVILAVLLSSQGVAQTWREHVSVQTVERGEQTLVLGPVASQEAIKQLGSNGGGYYNANAAHPLENPTPLSNFLEMLAILLLPAALVYTYGVMVGDTRQGWALIATMAIIFLPLAWLCILGEESGNPLINQLLGERVGNLEGKEVRFGAGLSSLWVAATTAVSNGSVNAMHDSLMPTAQLVALLLMQLGEVIFGGVGVGIYTMLVYVMVTVFLTGLMVGRTPEFLGKKLGVFEIKMASLVIIAPSALAVIGAALAVVLPAGLSSLGNPGEHGLTQALYAFNSAANNNGSAFAGLMADTPFYNITLGMVMLAGRYVVMIPVLAMAGALASRGAVPSNAGTLSTHTLLFVMVLAGTILLVGILTHVPSLALGPVVEYLHLQQAVQP